MSNNRTELVFILDRSGSMAGLESDTIGGYNALLKKQQQAEGEATVTTVLFDDQYELLHDRIDLRAVSTISEKEYYVRGCTALLDAVGKTIGKIARVQKSAAAPYRAGKVLFVITTDGMENASREFTYRKLKALIERQKKEFGWEFLFLGANIDAIETAGQMGITADRAANYCPDSTGTEILYDTMAEAVSQVRACKPLQARWKESIEADYERRGR